MMRRLIRDLFAAAFGPDTLQASRDSAVLTPPPGHRLAFTTDAFVVKPLFFPGGDIGSLAVNGTVNDLAMAGARPLALSCAMILEEGLPMESLWRVVLSMKQAADAAGVPIVTGDTKVVDKGKGDGLFITTSGVGAIPDGIDPGPHRIRPGDAIIVNGDIARHGMAIVAAREELALTAPFPSDCAPLAASVAALRDAGLDLHALRDATRGGIASAIIELAADAGAAVTLDEAAIPVREEVRGICELLGFDPLYVANEGRFVCFVPGDQAAAALAALRGVLPGAEPAVIGTVGDTATGRVTLTSLIGARRPLDLLSGEQLPRIC
jgi:hydrogenase expression/formation protein HypE